MEVDEGRILTSETWWAMSKNYNETALLVTQQLLAKLPIYPASKAQNLTCKGTERVSNQSTLH